MSDNKPVKSKGDKDIDHLDTEYGFRKMLKILYGGPG